MTVILAQLRRKATEQANGCLRLRLRCRSRSLSFRCSRHHLGRCSVTPAPRSVGFRRLSQSTTADEIVMSYSSRRMHSSRRQSAVTSRVCRSTRIRLSLLPVVVVKADDQAMKLPGADRAVLLMSCHLTSMKRDVALRVTRTWSAKALGPPSPWKSWERGRLPSAKG